MITGATPASLTTQVLLSNAAGPISIDRLQQQNAVLGIDENSVGPVGPDSQRTVSDRLSNNLMTILITLFIVLALLLFFVLLYLCLRHCYAHKHSRLIAGSSTVTTTSPGTQISVSANRKLSLCRSRNTAWGRLRLVDGQRKCQLSARA